LSRWGSSHVVFLLVAALLLLTISSVSMFGQYPEDPNPFVYLSLDGESTDGVIDSSADDITASLLNFPSSPFVPGVVSNALQFTGNSHISLNHANPLNLTNGFTISVLYSGNSSIQNVNIAQSTDTEGNAWTLGINTNGVAQFQFTDSQSNTQTLFGTSAVSDNRWHHFIGAYATSNSQATLYVDGVAEAMGMTTNWNFSIAQSLILGNSYGLPSNELFKLDEVRFYGAPLPYSTVDFSQMDVSQLFETYSRLLGSGLPGSAHGYPVLPGATGSSNSTVTETSVGIMHHHFFCGDGGCSAAVPFGFGTTMFDVPPGNNCGLSSITINPGFDSTVVIKVNPDGPTFTGDQEGCHTLFGYNDSGSGVTVTMVPKAKIFYSNPANGTNLTVCAGTTNEVESTVQLMDGTPVTMGMVNWSVGPSTLGTFTVNDVSLDGSGKAKTMFVASTNGAMGTMTAKGFELKDASGTPLSDATTNMTVNIPKVELKEMWEKDNKCNDLATQNTKGTTPNRLFVSVEANNKAELHIKTALTPAVTGIGSHIVWGVLDGTTLLPESGTLQDNGEADVIFATTGDHKVYTIRVGCDKNGDGKLQQDEIEETPKPPAKPFTVLVVTQSDYSSERRFLTAGTFVSGLPTAKALLDTFVTGAPPEGAIFTNVSISSTNPSLTHVAGAIFLFPACTATIAHYKFPDGSKVSNRVEKSDTIDTRECTFLLTKKAEVEAFFASSSDKEHEFTFTWTESFDWTDRDLHLAFGRITLNATIKATVTRDLKIKSVRTTGGFMDLYDFNYEQPATFDLNRRGATVQLGWNARAGNDAGRIFEDDVVIDSDLNKWKNIFRK